MNKLCKILTAVIAAAVVLCIGVYAQQPDSESVQKQLLSALKIVADENNDDKPVSRIEFLKLSLRLTDVYSTAEGYVRKTVFKDVAAESKDNPFVSFAYDAGYISGYDGCFYPERTITLNEARSILISVTGYRFIAECRGEEYAAQAMGMCDNMHIAGTDPIKYSNAYKLIYNILEAPYQEMRSAGDELTFDDSKQTIMSQFLHVRKERGILRAAGSVSLTDSKYDSQYAVINGQNYLCSLDEAENFVGYCVNYYYRTNIKDDDEIVAMFPTRNDTLMLDACQLETGDAAYTKNNIVYTDESDHRRSAKIKDYADMIYNREAYPDYDKETLSPKEGKLTLVDNDGDGVYDVIIMEEYVNIVISRLNSDDRVVIGKNNRVSLDNSDGQDVVIYGSDGSYYEFGDLSQEDVLTVYSSKSGRKITAYDTSSKVFDEIRSVSDDGNRITVTAGVNTYEVDRNFSAGAAYAQKPISLDTKTGLYLDMFDRIAGIGEANAEFNCYGYIFKIAKPSSIENKYQLKLFTKKGIFEIFTLKNTLMCQGVWMSAENAYDDIVARGTYNVIMYDSNSNNEITSIEFPIDNTVGGKYLEGKFSKDASVSGQNGEYRTGIFGSKYLISNKTVVFGVPDMTKPANREEKNFKLMSIDSFSENTYYTLDIYDIDEVYCAGLILSKAIADKVSFASMSDEVVVVNKVLKAVDSEGEEYDVIYAWHRGSYVTWNLSNRETDNVLKDISRGDILKVYRDSDGTITYTTRIIHLGKSTPFSESAYDGDYSGARGYMEYGKVGAIKNGAFVVTTDGGATVRPHKIVSAYVYLYDTETGKVTKSDINNIYAEESAGAFDGDSVFLNIKWNRVKDIVIVR